MDSMEPQALESEPMALQVTLPTIEQARAVKDALDVYARLAIGQLDVITGLVRDGTIPIGGRMGSGQRIEATIEQIEQVEELVNQIKAVLAYPRNGSNGIGNPHVHPSGHRAYEVMKAVARAIAIETNPNPSFRGVDYDGLTVRYTQDPAPTVGRSHESDTAQRDAEMLRKALQEITEVEPGLVTTSIDMRNIAKRALS